MNAIVEVQRSSGGDLVGAEDIADERRCQI